MVQTEVLTSTHETLPTMSAKEESAPVSTWVVICGTGAILAALPSLMWRALVGFGLTLGTPETWRRAVEIPGEGTSYVLGLSAVQFSAALLTLVLFVRNADRVPRWSPVAPGRRAPTSVVVGAGLIGAALTATLCGLSILNWDQVNPFSAAENPTGWAYLCWGCYLVAPAWPVLLAATAIGYGRARS